MSFTPTRRTFLTGLAAAPAAALLPTLFGRWPAAAASQPDYAALRTRWTDLLTGRAQVDTGDTRYATALGTVEAAASTAVGHLVTDAARTSVFDDAPLNQNAGVLLTYRRFESMALAWATPGTGMYADGTLLTDLVDGLRTAHHHGYNPGVPEYGNWWTWEIGVPRALANTLAIIWDEVDQTDIADACAAIDFYVPDPWFVLPEGSGRKPSTGANRVDLCQGVIIRSLLDGDTGRLEHARAGLVESWSTVTSGDGFYPDGSMLQHATVPYTGSYGVVLLTGLSRLFALLETADDPGGEYAAFYDLVDRSFLPVVHRGQVMDAVRGRAVSRSQEPSREQGMRVLEALVAMSGAVAATTAQRWVGLCRTWLADLDGAITMSTVTRVSALRTIESATVPAVIEPVGVTLFGSMDRAIVRRPGWAYTIAASSKRIAWYECGNGENDKGYHSGSGMGYLYTADTAHFDDAFWPTVDRYRLPGTTASQLALPDRVGGQWGAGLPQGEWTGGTVLDAQSHDAALAFGQHLLAPGNSGLSARKSWFTHQGRIVALGADVTSTGGGLIETVVENRNLHADGTNTLVVDGNTEIAALGSSKTVHGPSWAHLEDVAGYVFGPGSVLKMKREERAGAWADINTAGAPDVLHRRYLTLWLWHGTRPQQATYEYTVLPGATAAQTADYGGAPQHEVLANTAQQQGVRFGADLRLINFWQGGTVDGVTSDGPSSVIVRRVGRAMQLAVTAHSDTPVQVTVSAPGYRQVLDAREAADLRFERSWCIVTAAGRREGVDQRAEVTISRGR